MTLTNPRVLWLTSSQRCTLWKNYMDVVYGIEVTIADSTSVPARTWFQNSPQAISGYRLHSF